ncbi:MAG: hypothetical protein IKT58_03155 [Oscillospiraceae bacterium]|nr:hypothetical protein [Oscillospiraceae bacterium]
MQGNCGECECRWSCEIDPERCNEWSDPVPMTNGDRIRAMSDEELEASIISVHLGYCPWCNRNCEYNGEHGCDTCISNWLKQPAEDRAEAMKKWLKQPESEE